MELITYVCNSCPAKVTPKEYVDNNWISLKVPVVIVPYEQPPKPDEFLSVDVANTHVSIEKRVKTMHFCTLTCLRREFGERGAAAKIAATAT